MLYKVTFLLGSAIAEAVSRWLPTAAARVWKVGFVVDKMASGHAFSEYFGFPCQTHFILPTSPSSQSPATGTIGHVLAARGPSMDSTSHFPNKKKILSFQSEQQKSFRETTKISEIKPHRAIWQQRNICSPRFLPSTLTL
jgi:hypothetical protein